MFVIESDSAFMAAYKTGGSSSTPDNSSAIEAAEDSVASAGISRQLPRLSARVRPAVLAADCRMCLAFCK